MELLERTRPNFLYITKKYFRVPIKILNTKIKSWSLPLLLFIIIIIIIIIIIVVVVVVSCHRPILPGNSLEPTVIPTALASSFTPQYFPYYV